MTVSHQAMKLSELLAAEQLDAAISQISISGMALDSREINLGDAFVALQGGQEHGMQYAMRAEQAGAVVVLSDAVVDQPELSIPVVVIPELRSKLGDIAARYFENPAEKMTLLGVTGTNGKTSVAYFIAQLLAQSHNCGFIGTIGVGKPSESMVEQVRTTPDVISLQQTLSGLSAQHCEAVAMEVSSHALDQGRVDGLSFDIGVFTNLSHDHLDYHGSMQAYAAAKKLLFTQCGIAHAVINVDDPVGLSWVKELQGQVRVTPFGLQKAQGMDGVFATELHLTASGMRMKVTTPLGELDLTSGLIGSFNASNLLAAIAVLVCMDFATDEISRLVAQLESAPGRMETFGGNNQPLVVVDYAHTPDALEKVLETLLEHCKGELVAVFGCGGDRDAAKRPVMGEIASRLASRIIVTNDNPRSEDPARIAEEIMAGSKANAKISTTLDRRRAIAEAIKSSKAGDCVLVAGKGHEAEQVIGAEVLAFDDRDVVRSILSERAA